MIIKYMRNYIGLLYVFGLLIYNLVRDVLTLSKFICMGVRDEVVS